MCNWGCLFGLDCLAGPLQLTEVTDRHVALQDEEFLGGVHISILTSASNVLQRPHLNDLKAQHEIHWYLKKRDRSREDHFSEFWIRDQCVQRRESCGTLLWYVRDISLWDQQQTAEIRQCVLSCLKLVTSPVEKTSFAQSGINRMKTPRSAFGKVRASEFVNWKKWQLSSSGWLLHF